MHFLDLADRASARCTACCAARPRRSPTRPTPRRRRAHLVRGGRARANAWAAALRELGVGRGDTVAFLIKSCPEFVCATFGCLQLGAIWIPTNTDYRARGCARGSRTRRAGAGGRRGARPRVAELGAGLPFEHAVVRGSAQASRRSGARVSAAEIERAPAKRAPDDPARVPATPPRAVDLGHHRPLEGRDAEPQRVDPRGALGRARTRASARATCSTGACRCTTRRPGWRTSTARSSRASRSGSIRRSRCRVLGPLPTLRRDQIFTLGAMHIYLWQAPERADDARQPGAPRGLRADARCADRAVQEALRHRDARPGLRPERGARHAARTTAGPYKADSLGQP